MNLKPLQALVWKEWREHLFRMLAICGVMAIVATIGFQHHAKEDIAPGLFIALMIVASFVMPLFVTMAIGAERHHGQLSTLLVQPVAPPLILAAKTLMGCVTLVLPIVIVSLLARALMNEQDYNISQVPISMLYATLATVVTFIWMLAFAIRGSNEVRVGAVSILVLVFSFLAMVCTAFLLEYFGYLVDGYRLLQCHPFASLARASK